MTKDEILALAGEVYDYDFRDNTPQSERLITFATACFNKGLERAAAIAEKIAEANPYGYSDASEAAAAIREEMK